MKNALLLGLFVVALFLVWTGDLRVMLTGVLVAILGLDIQAGLNAAQITRGVLGLEEDFRTLESRLTEYLDRRITEIKS